MFAEGEVEALDLASHALGNLRDRVAPAGPAGALDALYAFQRVGRLNQVLGHLALLTIAMSATISFRRSAKQTTSAIRASLGQGVDTLKAWLELSRRTPRKCGWRLCGPAGPAGEPAARSRNRPVSPFSGRLPAVADDAQRLDVLRHVRATLGSRQPLYVNPAGDRGRTTRVAVKASR